MILQSYLDSISFLEFIITEAILDKFRSQITTYKYFHSLHK